MPQEKNKKILTYFFLFLMAGTFHNKNLKNINLVKIDKINIIGLDKNDNLQLVKSLNYLKAYNLYFLNKDEIKDTIDKNSLVEKYFVFKKYPSTINIKINKTNFLAKINKRSDSFLIGSNGKLIKTTNIEKNLPFIFGEFKIENFFELKILIDESDLNYDEIRNLFFFKSGRWDIEMNNGILIKLPKDKIKESLELLITFLAENKNNRIDKIDLRQHNQIIING